MVEVHLVRLIVFCILYLTCEGFGGVIALAESLSVELRWDANAESNLTGYNIYRSTQSRSGYYRLNQAIVTATSFKDESLAPGQTYYYACTAVNSVGLESGYSNEVSYQVPGPPPGENHPPNAGDDVLLTSGTPPFTIDVLANDVDIDGDPLLVTSTTQGVYGSVSINADKSITYSPGQAFQGEDSFHYTIIDGRGGTDTAVVTLTPATTSTNHAPVTRPDGAATTEGVPVLINVVYNDEDPDGDPLIITAVTKPPYGVTEIHDKAIVRYTPPDKFEGVESFEYVVSDGQTSAKGKVTVEVAHREVPRRMLIFPSFIDTGDPYLENTYVGVGLLNPGDQPNIVSLVAHDDEGSEVLNVQLGETLRRSGQAAFMTWEVLDPSTDSATLAVQGVTGPLMGFFMVGDFSLQRLDGVGAELPAATKLYIPGVRNSETDTTLLQVINRDEESDARVRIAIFEPDGSLKGEVEAHLAPLGSFIGTVSQIFGETFTLDQGFIEISSDFSVSSYAVMANSDSLSSFAARAGASDRTLTAPQFIVDETSGSTSILRILNTANKEVRIRVRVFDDESELLATSEAIVSSRQLWVRDLRTIFEEVPHDSVSGYLEVEVQGVLGAQSSIVSSITYSAFDGRSVSTLPLIADGWMTTIFPHVAQTADGAIYTGLSLLNPHDQSVGVTIEAFDQNGTKTARKRLTLPPRTRAIDLLRSETFFGNSFEQVKGHLRVESSRKIVIFSIFGDYQGTFMSTIEGQRPPS